jgi:hypothetical protein
MAGRQALVPLRLVGAVIAEGLARILLFAAPRFLQSQRTQHGASESSSQPAQRLPSRQRVIGQRLGQFIPLVSHFNHLS